jgi:hypothetical protein
MSNPAVTSLKYKQNPSDCVVAGVLHFADKKGPHITVRA